MHVKEQSKNKNYLVIIGLILCAIFIRYFFFVDFTDSIFAIHHDDYLDAGLYHEWGVQIAQGNIIGEVAYSGMPLYAYCVGIIYALFGINPVFVIVIQHVIGVLTLLIFYIAIVRTCGINTGVLGIILILMCGIIVLYEGFLIGTSLEIFLGVLISSSALLGYKYKKIKYGYVVAAVGGLATLARPTFLLVTIVLGALLANTIRKKRNRSFYLHATLLLLIAITPILTSTIRNYCVLGKAIPLTVHGGINFYLGNYSDATGTFNVPQEFVANSKDIMERATYIASHASNKELSLDEVSQYWYERALEDISENPIRWIKLLAKKILLFFSFHEIPDLVSFRYMKENIRVLSFVRFPLRIIMPCAILGCIFAIRRNPYIRILSLYIGVYSIGLLAYFVNTRYLMPILLQLIIVAAYGLIMIKTQLKEKKYGIVLASVLFIFAYYSTMKFTFPEYDLSVAYNNAAIMYKKRGMLFKAEEEYKKAIGKNRTNPFYYFNLGNLYLEKKNYAEAIELYKKAIYLNEKQPLFYEQIGYAYVYEKKYKQALVAFKKSIELGNNSEHLKANYEQLREYINK